MALPDASRLLAIGEDGWAALSERLRSIGLSPARALEVSSSGRESSSLPRQPLKVWRARKTKDPALFAMRMLFMHDPVTLEEATEALGLLLDRLFLGGLIVRGEAGIFSPLRLHYANDILLLSDDLIHGGDAVMGAGETTGELARMAYPADKRSSALDLGCGAGTFALLLSRLAPRVVGTDINPRAVALSRINAALNGIRTIEWRQGDLFAPVVGETFELIVSQPPFIPRHEGSADATYLFGGARGDELPLRVLRELPPYLAPGGRAVMLIMWPQFEGESLEARVRQAVSDSSLGITLFVSTPLDLDDWCTMYSAREHPTLGPEFDRTTISRREHLERAKIRALSMSATVVERPAHGCGWTSTVPLAMMSRLGHVHIDAALAARRLMAGPSQALLAAKLRAPPTATFTEDAAGQVHVRFDYDSPWAPLDINAATYTLVGALDESPDVQTAVDAVHARTRAPREKIMSAVEQALAHGVVEVVA